MKEDWERKYRAALMERIPALKRRRIDEAYKAVILRINETETTSDERERLDNAIELLNLLRKSI